MVEEFTKYYETFKKDKAITYKYQHSLRVMKIAESIALSLNLSDEEVYVAKLIGLLHDYSRFKQWAEFDSYNDLITFDHADMAAHILFDKNEIEKYDLDKKYYEIVRLAIKNHNKYKVPRMSKKALLFTKIIRDADKLDILNLSTKAIFTENGNKNYIHKSLNNYFFKHRSVRTPKRRTDNDLIVIKLAFIYDLNFNYSFNYIVKNNVIEKLASDVDQKLFEKYINEIKNYLKEKIC